METMEPEQLKAMHWEETIDYLTRDMPPGEVDVAELADRYREYVESLEEFELEVPAAAVRVCSALLGMKAAIVLEDGEEEEEEPREDPMDFEEEPPGEEKEPVDLEEPPELEMPVRPRPKRRMKRSELKEALRDAMEVKERREERQERRREMDQQFELEENALEKKLNSLYSRLRGLVSGEEDRVEFERLLEKRTSEEKMEKFMHVLSLETDRKVSCVQEEFLGKLHVTPEADEESIEVAE